MTQRSLRILIIDENAVRAAILEEGLRLASSGEEGGTLEVHHIRDTANLLARIGAVDPDVILIDLENPSRDTLEQMFQVSRLARRPIAMFVDKSDSATVQAAIDAGVSAYVVDGLRKERVRSILDVTISRFHAFDRLQSELHQAKSALEDRKIIEQAKAILMQQRGCSEDDAYVLLRRTAMNQNRQDRRARALARRRRRAAAREASMTERDRHGVSCRSSITPCSWPRASRFAAEAGIDLVLAEPSGEPARSSSLGHVDPRHALARYGRANARVGHKSIASRVRAGTRRQPVVVIQARIISTSCGRRDFRIRSRRSARWRRGAAACSAVDARHGLSVLESQLRFALLASAAGLHPFRDVRLVAIPPPLMVDSFARTLSILRVGEPWNSLAVAQGLGSIVASQSQLFPRAVEKVLAFRTAFAQQSQTIVTLLRALDAAAAWVDDASNHAALALLLARPAYLDLPPEIIAPALAGRMRFAAGAEVHDHGFLYFHRHDANAPREADGLWVYAQMVRWGQLAPSERAERVAARVFDPALYRESVPGVRVGAQAAPLPFDRVEFAAKDVPAYLGQFDVHTPYTDAHAL
jgi:response regulator NasT